MNRVLAFTLIGVAALVVAGFFALKSFSKPKILGHLPQADARLITQRTRAAIWRDVTAVRPRGFIKSTRLSLLLITGSIRQIQKLSSMRAQVEISSVLGHYFYVLENRQTESGSWDWTVRSRSEAPIVVYEGGWRARSEPPSTEFIPGSSHSTIETESIGGPPADVEPMSEAGFSSALTNAASLRLQR